MPILSESIVATRGRVLFDIMGWERGRRRRKW